MVPAEAKRTDIHVRIPPDLYAQLKQMSDAEDRSVNWILLEVARLGVREKTRRHARRSSGDE